MVVATAVLVAKAGRGPLDRDPDAWLWLTLFGVVLAVRFAAYAWRFWNPRKAAARVLLAFGSLWLVFVVLSHGAEPTSLAVVVLFLLLPLALTGIGLLGARPEREQEP